MERVSTSDVAVMLPTSPEEAAKAFGDGTGVTVLAGGTIVVPDITFRRLAPQKVLMLARSGLRNLAARAEKLGGELRLEPADPDAATPGTRLEWRVPR